MLFYPGGTTRSRTYVYRGVTVSYVLNTPIVGPEVAEIWLNTRRFNCFEYSKKKKKTNKHVYLNLLLWYIIINFESNSNIYERSYGGCSEQYTNTPYRLFKILSQFRFGFLNCLNYLKKKIIYSLLYLCNRCL